MGSFSSLNSESGRIIFIVGGSERFKYISLGLNFFSCFSISLVISSMIAPPAAIARMQMGIMRSHTKPSKGLINPYKTTYADKMLKRYKIHAKKISKHNIKIDGIGCDL